MQLINDYQNSLQGLTLRIKYIKDILEDTNLSGDLLDSFLSGEGVVHLIPDNFVKVYESTTDVDNYIFEFTCAEPYEDWDNVANYNIPKNFLEVITPSKEDVIKYYKELSEKNHYKENRDILINALLQLNNEKDFIKFLIDKGYDFSGGYSKIDNLVKEYLEDNTE